MTTIAVAILAVSAVTTIPASTIMTIMASEISVVSPKITMVATVLNSLHVLMV
jgi:hypothetical protein